MSKLAIKGQSVDKIKLLEILVGFGGTNSKEIGRIRERRHYYVNTDTNLISYFERVEDNSNYYITTLSSLLQLIKYNIGDYVKFNGDERGVIDKYVWDESSDSIRYHVKGKKALFLDKELTRFTLGKPKYKIGDKVTYEDCKGDFGIIQGINQYLYNKYTIIDEGSAKTIAKIEEDLKLYVEPPIIEEKKVCEQEKIEEETAVVTINKEETTTELIQEGQILVYGEPVEETNEIEITTLINFNDYNHDVELVLGEDRELVNKDGKYYVIIKKPVFPQNFIECCEVLEIDYDTSSVSGYENDLLYYYQRLLICRDAFWKIDKNWLPDWKDTDKKKYSIESYHDNLRKIQSTELSKVLSFSSEEICDLFLETFRGLIEECKELI